MRGDTTAPRQAEGPGEDAGALRVTAAIVSRKSTLPPLGYPSRNEA